MDIENIDKDDLVLCLLSEEENLSLKQFYEDQQQFQTSKTSFTFMNQIKNLWNFEFRRFLIWLTKIKPFFSNF